MHIVLSILLFGIILLSWLRVVRPFGTRLEGEPFVVVPMPLLARIRMHALPGIAGTVIALVLTFTSSVPLWLLAAFLLSFIAFLVLPVRYTLTPIGIRRGWSTFRRWTEFAGVARTPGGALLKGVNGSRSMRVWLSRSRGDDEFLQLLRQTIKDAYKGDYRPEVVVFPEPPPTHHIDESTTIRA